MHVHNVVQYSYDIATCKSEFAISLGLTLSFSIPQHSRLNIGPGDMAAFMYLV